MMKKIIWKWLPLLTGILLISLASCTQDTESQELLEQEERFFDIYMQSQYPEAETLPSGLRFLSYREGDGKTPGPEDWVLIDYVSYAIPANKVLDTYVERVAIDQGLYDDRALYGPYKTRNGELNEGFTEGLQLMKEGGQATFFFTSELGYGSSNTGGVGAYQSLRYDVELIEVLGPDIEAYEAQQLLNYVDTISGIDTIQDLENESTIYYVLLESSDGPQVGLDSTLEVTYKGYLRDGRIFEEITADDPFIFIPSQTEWVARWDKVLPRLKEGESVRMIFPWQSAYGDFGQNTSSGNRSVPPYETLIFDLEVISVEAELEDDDNEAVQ